MNSLFKTYLKMKNKSHEPERKIVGENELEGIFYLMI